MNRQALWVAIPVGVIVVLFVLLLATSDTGGGQAGSDQVGTLAPEMVAVDSNGESFDLDALRGRWVIVNFFATWCAPCVNEHPELVVFAEASDPDEVAVVSIAFNDSAENVAQFFADNGGDWPVLLDDTLAIDWSVAQVPESFIVAPNGRVAAHVTGGVTADDLQAAIRDLSGSA
ncbi:MAG: TlpA family protein disulfide reductase [Acidimicrobiales bacterium]